ncbi:unnamed protein product, partial [Gulo gulo]
AGCPSLGTPAPLGSRGVAVEGQFVWSTDGGNTRKWPRTRAAPPPGDGCRVPGGGEEGTLLFGLLALTSLHLKRCWSHM